MMKSILFVCTDNIFRSMIAEYALKAVLGPQPAFQVSSAGTEAKPQAMAPEVITRLLYYGLAPTAHRQRRVTQEMLHQADLVVAILSLD
jgi:protein-tyrosine phosphatase